METPGAIVGGRYRLERELELGRGAQGVVYAAFDLVQARPVALKLLDGALRDPRVERRYQRDARALAALHNDHVVRLHSYGTHQGAVFLAMDLVRGRALDSVLESYSMEGRRMPLVTAMALLERVADGLDAVHRAGLVHRDVKPANVVVEDGTRRPVVVDFGFGLDARDELMDALGSGTPEYMAPELAAGGHGSIEADIYAFGCTAFEVLTGELPFAAPTVVELLARHAVALPPRASAIRPSLAPADGALRRGLAKDPRSRHASCGALVRDVQRALGTSLGPESGVTLPGHEHAMVILILEADVAAARDWARAASSTLLGPSRQVVAPTRVIAVKRLGNRAPRLAMIDLEIPGAFGLVDDLREMHGGDVACVVAVAPASGPVEARRLAELGVLDVLRKPLGEPELTAGLQLVARRRGLPSSSASPPRAPPRAQ